MLLEQVGHLVGAVDDEHALAVVAAARGLEHDRPADVVGEGGDRRGRCDASAQAGCGSPASASARRSTSLSCAWTSAAGPGRDPVAGRLQGAQVLGRHVLVVEGDDGGAVGERRQGGEVAVVAEPDVGGDQGGGLGRVGGQHAQRLAEGDRRLVRHPGQLPAADHRHDGQAGARVEGAAMVARG